jgi:hypothetical protein
MRNSMRSLRRFLNQRFAPVGWWDIQIGLQWIAAQPLASKN